MTVNLIIQDESYNKKRVLLFGGLPPTPKDELFEWPTCNTCGGALQYLGWVLHPLDQTKRIAIFMCANNPGMCDEWEAGGGGNATFVFNADAKLKHPKPPKTGIAMLEPGKIWSGYIEEIEGETYRDAYLCAVEELPIEKRGFMFEALSPRDENYASLRILGQYGGIPDWIQGDETPLCPRCGQPMMLAAQLEEGPYSVPVLNFGTGNAYLFICNCDINISRFLWQC